MKKKKLNVKNLIKLIAMIVCILIIANDFIEIAYYSLKGMTIGFTLSGMIIDSCLLLIICLIEDDLFDK